MRATTEQHTRRIHHGHCTSTPPLVATPLRCHPPSEGQANEEGTKGGGRGANNGSPKTTISPWMLMEPPLKAHPGSHVPPSNAMQGEETSQGDGGKVGTPPGIKFDGTTSKKSADRAEAPNGGHPRDSRWESTACITLSPKPALGKREQAHRLQEGAVSNSTWWEGSSTSPPRRGVAPVGVTDVSTRPAQCRT